MDISTQLRQIIQQQQATPNHIAKLAGIDKSTMSRFMNGGSLTLSKLDKIGNVLGIELHKTIDVIPSFIGRPKS